MAVNITHVIFDMDGLIFDTEDKYTEVFDDVLMSLGHRYTYDLKREIMGMQSSLAMEYVVKKLDLQVSPNDLSEMLRIKYTPDLFRSVIKMPGVEDLVNNLCKNNIPIAIATGSSTQNFIYKTENHQDFIKKFLHVVKAGDPEVRRGKPDPDIYLVCANRFPKPPVCTNNVLVFEDAINGVISALQAGMYVVWVPDPREPEGLPDIPIIKSNKSRILRLRSLKHFNPLNYGLAPFE